MKIFLTILFWRSRYSDPVILKLWQKILNEEEAVLSWKYTTKNIFREPFAAKIGKANNEKLNFGLAFPKEAAPSLCIGA